METDGGVDGPVTAGDAFLSFLVVFFFFFLSIVLYNICGDSKLHVRH